MSFTNVEIKAHCTNTDRLRAMLEKLDADFIGRDHQIDTYFNVDGGRLKLREGTIENNLIYYRRADTTSPKTSDIHLVPDTPAEKLKPLLDAALGVAVTVDKQRDIYFIENVKFHLDEVQELGSFVEIEAIDEHDTIGEEKLTAQCTHYMHHFSIREEDLIAQSYADMLLQHT